MKKSLFLLLAIISCASIFTSCSKDTETDPVVPQSDLVGKWALAPIVTDKDQLFVSGGFSMVWEAPEGTKLGFFDLKDVPPMVNGLGSIALSQVLKDVTFNADGNITATYSSAGISLDKPVTPVWELSNVGYASFEDVPAEKLIKVKINVNKIAESDPSILEVIKLLPKDIQDLIVNGVPVHYELDKKSGAARFYLDQKFMSTFLPYIQILIESIKDEDLNGMGALIKMFLADVPKVMEVTTKFEIGLNTKLAK